MNDIAKLSLPALLLLTACASTGTLQQANLAPESVILSEADVNEDVAPWGSFLPYFTDDTHYLSPVLVGVAKIDAGQQIHPPHRHADEEYLMVTNGRGVWSLNGVERSAREGDILFARAWDYHGIKADPDSPLEFVVFKFSGKGDSTPTDPNPDWPEEQE